MDCEDGCASGWRRVHGRARTIGRKSGSEKGAVRHRAMAFMTNVSLVIPLLAIALAGANSSLLAAEPPASTEKAPPPHRFGREAALEDARNMVVATGLEATLFACEPDVVNPCNMDVDERSRVWITEGANYRSTFQKWGILRPGGDRIVILEDTNGDGTADKTTVFYQDPSVNSALGVCVLGNKVIVSSSPNIFILTDTDGDGVADKRELLFTGISGIDNDHGVHTFVFGPDGKLYFNFGNASHQIRRPPSSLRDIPLHGVLPKEELNNAELVRDFEGREVIDHGKPFRQGMAFRCNLDGSEFQVLGHNFRNDYEVCVDSCGTVWRSDQDDDGNRGSRVLDAIEFGN